MSNIATNIEQSKHLLELGLSKETADMSYSEEYFGKDKDGNDEWCWRLNACKFVDVEGIIPAWSLTALLEVMPIKITKDKVEYKLAIFPSGLFSTHSDTSTWTVQYCGKDYSYRSKDRFPKLAIFKEYTLIDAVHEMVCWLLEQGFIKKGGEQ